MYRTRLALALGPALAVACIVALPACKKETTVTTPGGTVSVTEGSETVTVTGPKGEKVVVKPSADEKNQTVTVTDKKGDKIVIASKAGGVATEKELGVPLYPGAKADESGSVMIQAQQKGKTGGYGVWVFKTGDSFDKVFGFYKTKVKAARTFQMEQQGKQTGMLMITKEGLQQTVQVQRDGDQTVITISRVGG